MIKQAEQLIDEAVEEMISKAEQEGFTNVRNDLRIAFAKAMALSLLVKLEKEHKDSVTSSRRSDAISTWKT